MKMGFRIEPLKNRIEGKVILKRNEIESTDFFLNRDFVIERLIVDDEVIDPQNIVSQICLEDSFNYLVNKYSLPNDVKTIEIDYVGKLTGKTGSCPYVREQISESFSLLRFETYCYPLFIPDEERGLFEYLKGGTKIDQITVDVPEGYYVVSSEKLMKKKVINSRLIYSFKGNWRFFNAAIAKYKKLSMTSGEFYLLGQEIDEEFVERSLSKTHAIMNKYFGERDIKATIKYVVIPDGFGQFIKNDTVFITVSDLSNKGNIANIIHEFIHLGWNAKVGTEVQRCRFFDEGFTNYFTLRVLEELWGSISYHNHIEKYISSYNYRKECLSEIIPIAEFGLYDCGELSYSIGALLLKELEEIIGRTTFDYITREFLGKYRYQEVNFELFCEAYIEGCNSKELIVFFDNWLYGTSGYGKYNRN